jgi:DNA-binding NarL/FixJ family response regulator
MSPDVCYRALIVDDEPTVRQAAMRALNQCGFVCDVAAEAHAAIELARQMSFDVVVTDLRMPEINGHTLAVELLQLSPPPAVVILTGVLEPRLSDDLWARGVADIQYKPINFSLLAIKIRRLVEQRLKKLPAEGESNLQPAPQPNNATFASTAPPIDKGESQPVATNSCVGVKSSQGHAALTPELQSPAQHFANRLSSAVPEKLLDQLQQLVCAKSQQSATWCLACFIVGATFGWLLNWLVPFARILR